MTGREEGDVRDKTGGLGTTSVETEIADHTHLRALDTGFAVRLGLAPALEDLQGELGRVLGYQKGVEPTKKLALRRVATAQSDLEVQIPSNDGRER
jgi:hypothetical protein